MMNKNLVEDILKEYCNLRNRVALIERLQDTKHLKNHGVSINNSVLSIKGDCLVDKRIQKQNAMIHRLVDSVDNTEKELSSLYKSINIVEEALNVLKDVNENYHLIISEHFINHVRVEDLEEMLGLSRSRCYELRKRSIEELTVILMGKV